MGVVVDFEQPCGVHAGVDLRRGKAGMAEQLLNGAQVSATGQKMRGEGMSERMRRGVFREAESAAELLHCPLNDGWLQRAASAVMELIVLKLRENRMLPGGPYQRIQKKNKTHKVSKKANITSLCK